MSVLPSWDAMNSGVAPFFSALSTAALLSMSSLAVSVLPSWDAMYSGVAPSFVALSTAALLSMSSLAVSVLSSLVDSGLALDEQPRSVRLALPGMRPQRSPRLIILPVDRCFDFNQSLGFFRVSAFTGIVKFLGDWRNAHFKVRSARGRAAAAVRELSPFCRSLGSRRVRCWLCVPFHSS